MLLSIRMAVVADQPALRRGLTQHLLETMSDVRVVSSTDKVADVLASEESIDLVLLVDAGDAATATVDLTRAGPRVVVHTADERAVPLRRALRAGASGVLLARDPLTLVAPVIRAAVADADWSGGARVRGLVSDESVPELSRRQVEVLRAVDEGRSYHATAKLLGVSEGVVKTHLGRIREKYRSCGIEPGNTHHVTRLARDAGYLG